MDLLESVQKFASKVCCMQWSSPNQVLLDTSKLSSLQEKTRSCKTWLYVQTCPQPFSIIILHRICIDTQVVNMAINKCVHYNIKTKAHIAKKIKEWKCILLKSLNRVTFSGLTRQTIPDRNDIWKVEVLVWVGSTLWQRKHLFAWWVGAVAMCLLLEWCIRKISQTCWNFK